MKCRLNVLSALVCSMPLFHCVNHTDSFLDAKMVVFKTPV